MKKLKSLICIVSVLILCLCLTPIIKVSADTTVTQVYATVPTPIIGKTVGDASYGYSGTPGIKVTEVNWTDANGSIYSDNHGFLPGVTYYCDVEFTVEDGYTFPANYTQLTGYINNKSGEISTVYYTDHAYVTVGMKPYVDGEIYVAGVGLSDDSYYSVLTGAITSYKPQDNYVYYKDGVLTLHNFNYKGQGLVLSGNQSKYSAGIYSRQPLSIVLEGNNTIEIADRAVYAMGIYIDNDLSITGTAGSTLTSSGNYAVTLSDKLTIDGGSYVLTSDSDALYTRKDCVIQNCSLNINSAESGVYGCANISLINVDATMTARKYHALCADKKISISGCDFSIETGDSGIKATALQMESSTFDITAYDSGIEILEEDSTIKNCFISIAGEYGIYAEEGDLSLEGCAISIEATSAGIMTDYSDLYITDCRISAYSSIGGNALIALDGSVIFDEELSVRATAQEGGAWEPYNAANAKYYYLVDVHKHLADEGTVTRDSTCSKVGIRTYKCTVCDEVLATHTIPKAAHEYAAATCTKPKTCKICGATTGSKLGHNYEKKITKATLTADGSIKNVCKVCGYTASKVTTIYKASSIKLSQTSYIYNGKEQKPTVIVKDSKGNTISASNYTVTYASGCKTAGTYKVTVKMKGNYSGTKTLSYTIKPIDISKCTISLSKTAYTYNGKVQKPTVTVKNGNGTKLSSGTHYTVTYASGCKTAGTYKVTVKMKGNYSGTKTLTFKINPIDISKCKVSLSATSYTYDGKVKTPSVTVKNASGTTLKKDTHYTVSYASGRKNVGTYKVTVKMKGNYTGTKTLTFKINPVKTGISKVAAGAKKLTVAITKKSTQVTGYEIQYSTSKSFSSYKTKTVSSYKTTSVDLTGLKANTTYYIRVRTYKTVNGVKYYSGWSAIETAKTK